MSTPENPMPSIIVPGTAVPYADLIPADGQFVDEAGNPIPWVVASGHYQTTTVTPLVAGKTSTITVADVGLSIGDWITVTNGIQTDEPRQIIAIQGSRVTVSTPIGISGSGTSEVDKTKITPALSWYTGGKAFGDLAYNASTSKLSGVVEVRSNVSSASKGTVTVEILISGKVKATKVSTIGGVFGTCKELQQPTGYAMAFGVAAALAPGVQCRIRAYASFSFLANCNIRGGTYTLGPRLGPVYSVPV